MGDQCENIPEAAASETPRVIKAGFRADLRH